VKPVIEVRVDPTTLQTMAVLLHEDLVEVDHHHAQLKVLGGLATTVRDLSERLDLVVNESTRRAFDPGAGRDLAADLTRPSLPLLGA
jgi:hypothetical protein